jgi:hypothetical protein
MYSGDSKSIFLRRLFKLLLMIFFHSVDIFFLEALQYWQVQALTGSFMMIGLMII